MIGESEDLKAGVSPVPINRDVFVGSIGLPYSSSPSSSSIFSFEPDIEPALPGLRLARRLEYESDRTSEFELSLDFSRAGLLRGDNE